MRKETDRTQKDVATYMGISQAAYSRLEKGEIELTVQKLFALSDLYSVPVDQIIRGI
jgi:transcriptional regulator with XRE-family HTH domain